MLAQFVIGEGSDFRVVGIEIFLARFTTTASPFDWAEQHGARFIDLTQARSLPAVELQLLRRAHEQIPG